MCVNVSKCKVMHTVARNQNFSYMLTDSEMDQERERGVGERLDESVDPVYSGCEEGHAWDQFKIM